jgi:hypothetical protein
MKFKPLDLTGKSWPGMKLEDLSFGKALCVVDLVDCIKTDDLALFVALHGQVLDQISQSFSPGKLAYQQCHKLSTAVEGSEAAPNMVFAGKGFKFMSLEKTDYLIQDCVTMGHGSDILVCTGVLANAV